MCARHLGCVPAGCESSHLPLRLVSARRWPILHDRPCRHHSSLWCHDSTGGFLHGEPPGYLPHVPSRQRAASGAQWRPGQRHRPSGYRHSPRRHSGLSTIAYHQACIDAEQAFLNSRKTGVIPANPYPAGSEAYEVWQGRFDDVSTIVASAAEWDVPALPDATAEPASTATPETVH
jgi:hypothetical protein